MFQRGLTPPDPFGERSPLEEARTQDDMSVQTLAEMGRVLLVFLPTLGSVLGRELLGRVREDRPELERLGARVVLVHMGYDTESHTELERYELQYVARIADPERALYRHFDVREAGAWQRFRPAVLGRAIGAARHGRGPLVGSPNQLHAAVLLDGSKEPRSLRPTLPGEPLDLMSLVR